MIEGLKLDVPAAELVQRLADAIVAHESRVDGCERRLRRLVDLERAGAVDPVEVGWDGGYRALRAGLERKRGYHRQRAMVLTFLRDHVVADEVYRLNPDDLRLAEVIP